jgi:hypothetical protein
MAMGSWEHKHTWTSDNLETKIYGTMDGDLQVVQVNTKTKKKNFLNGHYDFWLPFTAISMKYFDQFGIELPEIKNWRETLKRYGWDGQIKKPGNFGVGYESFPYHYTSMIIAQFPDRIDAGKVNKLFFGRIVPESTHEVHYIPIIDLEQRLLLCSNSSHSDSEIKPLEVAPFPGEFAKYYPCIIVQKKDVYNLFEGAVKAIFSWQTRTRPEFFAYMFWEYDQIKDGKTPQEIMTLSHSLE